MKWNFNNAFIPAKVMVRIFFKTIVIIFLSFFVEISNAEVLKTDVALDTTFPNHPTYRKVIDKGIMSKDSPWFWEDPAGKRGPNPPYKPLNDGFTIVNGKSHPLQASHRQHWLIYQNNRIHIGDKPIANTRVIGGSFMYGTFDSFPITGVSLKDAVLKGTDSLSLGAVRFAVKTGSKVKWLDEFEIIETSFRPGLAQWKCSDSNMAVSLSIEIRPNISARGFICRIKIDQAAKDAKLVAFYGLVGLSKWPYSNFSYTTKDDTPNPPNKIIFENNFAQVTSEALPRALTYFTLTGESVTYGNAPENVFDIGNGNILPIYDNNNIDSRQCAYFETPISPGRQFYALSVWGADGYDETKARQARERLSKEALGEPYNEKVWEIWFDNFIGRQLEPRNKFLHLMKSPSEAWSVAESFWKERASRWQIDTPNNSFNASANWVGQTIEYFRQPPGYMLGQLMWCGYGHITSGWYVLGSMGDTDNLAAMLGMYAGTRQNPTLEGQDPKVGAGSKEIRWTFLNLETTVSEPLNAPFIDHVWTCWQWTGDKEWLRVIWPAVRDAIYGEMAARDSDGDGLYHGFYEFWDCDLEQRGPKAAGETAWMISSLRAASIMAEALGLDEESKYYHSQSERSSAAFQNQLWYPQIGWCGGRGADDQRYERSSIHEVFIPAQRDVIAEKQAAQAFRRINYLYGQISKYDLPILFKNDVWPILWSQHYMPPGDTSLTYMAAAKCGLADEFFPYMEVIAASPLKSYHAGMGLSIGQDGAIDSMQNGNSDAQSPFAWAVSEGLFGIAPDGVPGKILISPNIPSTWPQTSATIGGISLTIKQSKDKVSMNIKDSKSRTIRIQWPTKRIVKSVRLNGKKVKYQLISAVNRAIIEMNIKADTPLDVEYEFSNSQLGFDSLPNEVVVNKTVSIQANQGQIVEVDDPQKCLKDYAIRKNINLDITPNAIGFHTIFIKLQNQNLSYWLPWSFNAGQAFEIVQEFQAPDPPREGVIKQLWPRIVTRRLPSFTMPEEHQLLIRFKNRDNQINTNAKVCIKQRTATVPVNIAPGSFGEITVDIPATIWNQMLPGNLEFSVEINGLVQHGSIYLWPDEELDGLKMASQDRQIQLDFDGYRTCTAAAMKKISVKQDFGAIDTLLGWYHPKFTMNNLPQNFEAMPGLFFKGIAGDSNDGEPMLVLAHTMDPNSPTIAEFKVNQTIEQVYALVVIDYYPIKAYSPQAEWVLHYADGTSSVHQLVPPFNINSMRRPESVGSYAVKSVGQFENDMKQVSDHFFGPFHAQVISIPVEKNQTVKSIQAKITSTESFMGILGITLIKPAQ